MTHATTTTVDEKCMHAVCVILLYGSSSCSRNCFWLQAVCVSSFTHNISIGHAERTSARLQWWIRANTVFLLSVRAAAAACRLSHVSCR